MNPRLRIWNIGQQHSNTNMPAAVGSKELDSDVAGYTVFFHHSSFGRVQLFQMPWRRFLITNLGNTSDSVLTFLTLTIRDLT